LQRKRNLLLSNRNLLQRKRNLLQSNRNLLQRKRNLLETNGYCLLSNVNPIATNGYCFVTNENGLERNRVVRLGGAIGYLGRLVGISSARLLILFGNFGLHNCQLTISGYLLTISPYSFAAESKSRTPVVISKSSLSNSPTH
jgi:hypothetical protein